MEKEEDYNQITPVIKKEDSSQIKPEEIMAKHPSVCYTCIHARNPASDDNRSKGYVGCAEYIRLGERWDYVGKCKELVTGWVDLRATIFGKKSGVITNCQLMTLEVRGCKKYSEIPFNPCSIEDNAYLDVHLGSNLKARIILSLSQNKMIFYNNSQKAYNDLGELILYHKLIPILKYYGLNTVSFQCLTPNLLDEWNKVGTSDAVIEFFIIKMKEGDRADLLLKDLRDYYSSNKLRFRLIPHACGHCE